MAKVINFSTKSSTPKIKKITLSALERYNNILDDALYDWNQAAKAGELNNLLHRKIPVAARPASQSTPDYLSNLNHLSFVEHKLGMRRAIHFPHTLQNNNAYIVAGFYHGDEFLCPPRTVLIESEYHARALNILLFIYYSNAL